MTSLVISIINYRTAELTLNCLATVLAEADRARDSEIETHVVVVDNASGDGSTDVISEWIAAQEVPPPVTLHRSDTNTGFAGGHNQGFSARDAEFYLVLNSDAELRDGFITTIIKAARDNPKAGLFAPRIETGDGEAQTSCFRFHSPASELIRAANSGPVTRILNRWDVPLGPDPDPTAIEWASFACILLRAEMIAGIGPMDDGYFLYYEDAEYCLRARRAGWRIVYVPAAVAVHHRGGSGPVKTLSAARRRLPTYYWRARSRFLTQAHGRFGLVLANLLWHAGRGIAWSRRLVGREVPPSGEAEAHDIWIGSRHPLAPCPRQ